MRADNVFVTKKPREKAGPRTGGRYAFQAHVALDMLLDLHAKAKPFEAVFDHFDDLVICDSLQAETNVRCYQIKGKAKGSWTAAAFCVPEKEHPKTIVGKMYHHTETFGARLAQCVFLTNASYNFTLANGKKTKEDDHWIAFSALGVMDTATLRAGLDGDYPPARPYPEADLIVFACTTVPIKRFEDVLRGRIAAICEDISHPAPLALYQSLIGDIISKSNETKEIEDLDELLRLKGLTSTKLQTVLDQTKAQAAILDNWGPIDGDLDNAGIPALKRTMIKTGVVEYKRSRLAGDTDAIQLSAAIRLAISTAGKAEVVDAATIDDGAKLIRQNIALDVLSNVGEIPLWSAIITEIFEAAHEK